MGLTQPSSHGKVGQVFLDRADGYGAVAGLLDDAVSLAQPILRTDPSADFREGVGRLAEFVGLPQPAFGCKPQPIRYVVVERTMGLAVGHAALRAPACLFCSLCRCVLVVDFTEILGAHHDGPLDRHFLDYVDECEHFPLGHILNAFCRPLSGTWRGVGLIAGSLREIKSIFMTYMQVFCGNSMHVSPFEVDFRAYLLTFMPMSYRKSAAEHPVTVLHLLIVAMVQGGNRVPARLLLRSPGIDPGPDRI